MPHWTDEEAVYFVTFRVDKEVLTDEEQQVVGGHLLSGNGTFYTLIASVVMPDHVHLIAKTDLGYSLTRVMKGIKGVSARKINSIRRLKRQTKDVEQSQVWQHESYDRIIRNQEELTEKLLYMLNNPRKRGLIEDPCKYPGWYYNDEFLEFR